MEIAKKLMELDYVSAVSIEENGSEIYQGDIPPFSIRIGILPVVSDEHREEVGCLISEWVERFKWGRWVSLVGEEMYIDFRRTRFVRWSHSVAIGSMERP